MPDATQCRYYKTSYRCYSGAVRCPMLITRYIPISVPTPIPIPIPICTNTMPIPNTNTNTNTNTKMPTLTMMYLSTYPPTHQYIVLHTLHIPLCSSRPEGGGGGAYRLSTGYILYCIYSVLSLLYYLYSTLPYVPRGGDGDGDWEGQFGVSSIEFLDRKSVV